MPRHDPDMLGRAKDLRRDPTPSERVLWRYLRREQILGLQFRRQAVIGPYIVDFFCPDAKLVVELDGESHVGKEGYDTARDEYLGAQGLTVLRFLDGHVHQCIEHVLTVIRDPCEVRVGFVIRESACARTQNRG